VLLALCNNFFKETRIPSKGNKIFPRNYVPTRSIRGTKLINENEFWIILPNQTSFEDTTKTLDELGEEIKLLEQVDLTKEEEDILKENKIYFAELQTVENEIDYDYYHDTKINIHQLAQNLNLMMDRIATSDDMIMHRSWVQLTDRRM
jgi:ATP-dependent RNA circularization protein (DNA/RNA ligase family)